MARKRTPYQKSFQKRLDFIAEKMTEQMARERRDPMPKATTPNPSVPQDLRDDLTLLIDQFGVGQLADALGVSRNVPRQWLLGLRTPTPEHRAALRVMLTTHADLGDGI